MLEMSAAPSDIAASTTDSVIKAVESSVISPATALKELRQQSHLTGVFTNISDEEIEAADNRPPPADVDPPEQFVKPNALGGMNQEA